MSIQSGTQTGRGTAAPSGRPRRALAVVARVAAALLGGYAFCWGFIALATALWFAAGMEFHDAEHLGYIVGMLVFLAVFLWAFAARSLARVWGVYVVGGLLMAGAASAVQYLLI